MSRAEEMSFESGGFTLAGTLHWPEGEGPHPALAMLQGSGSADRDSNSYFPPIRDHFVADGLAVLSWDKPGTGESSGHWTQQTLFDRAEEAIAGLNWLRAQDGIDFASVGIWGHSQGGWEGPLVASQYPALAFLIVDSGPGIGAEQQDLHGIEHTMRAKGATDEDVARALDFMRALHDAAKKSVPFDEVSRRIIGPNRDTPGFDYLGDFGADEWHFLTINFKRPYDPVSTLELVKCPILAIFGEKDPLVPVEESVRVFESVRRDAPNRDITTLVFPGADHRIKVGDPLEFAPGYFGAMTDWIWQRIRP